MMHYTIYYLLRNLRFLDIFPGWRRLVNLIASPKFEFEFIVNNNGSHFKGKSSSFIDREVFLYGNYEKKWIELFIKTVPLDRRRVVLDIGANVGTHSIAFSPYFDRVIGFEPNRNLWRNFEENININNLHNVTLEKYGLSDSDDEKEFYLIDKNNYGLGTFSQSQQYDLPLKSVDRFNVKIGDECLKNMGLKYIDAIKIDTQGFEYFVLNGLRQTIEFNQPVIWFECSEATSQNYESIDKIKDIFPYETRFFRFRQKRKCIFKNLVLEPVTERYLLPNFDYLCMPKS